MDRLSVRWAASAVEVSSDLWARAFPPPLEGAWWYRALQQGRLEDQFRFAYGVVEDGKRQIGIAPTFEMDVPIDLVAPPLIAKALRAAGRVVPRLRYQKTLFVGSPCSDEGTVGVIPGEPAGLVLEAVQDALEERARQLDIPMIVWKDFPDEARPDLDRLAAAHGLFPIVSFPGTRVELAGSSFEDYLAALKPPKRHRLRRNLRRGEEACSLAASVVMRPSEAVLSEMFALFGQTYERGKTKFERLTPEFFTAIAAEAPARFLLLREPATGRLAAFMLLFLAGRRAINKFIGMDYSLGRQAKLYFRLWEHALRWAYSVGASELQSGQTGYEVKLDLGHELVPLTNYCKHRNRMLHRLFAAATARVDWADLDEDLARASRRRAQNAAGHAETAVAIVSQTR